MVDVIELIKQDGREEGREEGKTEGHHQAKIETAQNLLQMGLTDEQIVQATGLTLEMVQSLK